MQTQGCKPDSITYCGLITAYERGGQWRRALKAFEQMQAQVGAPRPRFPAVAVSATLRHAMHASPHKRRCCTWPHVCPLYGKERSHGSGAWDWCTL